jgi:hypothetical protein
VNRQFNIDRPDRLWVRNGTTNLYAALDVALGNVIADLSAGHRAVEFRTLPAA